MALAAKLVRAKDGRPHVRVDLADFQALVDAAAIAEHGTPDTELLIRELRKALEAGGDYVDADAFLEQYDAAHGSG
jgi:hypothetical protein